MHYNKTYNKFCAAILASSLLAGCSTGVKMPKEEDFVLPSQTEILEDALTNLNDLPSLTHKRGYNPLVIEQPIVIPKKIREKYIDIIFEKNATFKDLPELLSIFGITAVIKNNIIEVDGKINSDASKEVNDYESRSKIQLDNFIESKGAKIDAKKKYKIENLAITQREDRQKYTYLTNFKKVLEEIHIELPSYQGTFQNLLDMLSDMHNISFNWQYGNYMMIEKFGNYTITIPQEEELLGEIVQNIKVLGALEVSSSLRAGSVTYKSTKKNHHRITKYINRLSYNTPSIGLQLAVVSVTLNRSSNKGFDWDSLKAIVGSPLTGQYIDGVDKLTNNVRTSMVGSEVTYGLSGSTASMAYASSNIAFSSAINLLDSYGDSKTEQSVMLKTLGGKPANFNTTQAVPYQSGTTSNVNSEGGIITSDTTTQQVEVGLKIDITPYYDADNEMLTMDVSFDSSSISGFVDTGDGGQQPSVQTQSFANKIKMRNDEVVIVGGVTFDSESTTISGLNIFDDDWDINGSKSEKSKTAMFIIIKPSVDLYGNFEEDKIIK
jgi:hypothetical protein